MRSDRRTTVVLRRARPEDAPAVGAVFDAAVRAGWTFLGEAVQEPMFAPKYWTELVERHAPPDALLVATDGTGVILGFTVAHAHDGEMYLLFVHPEHGGRGVGRMLLDAGHEVIREAGHSEAFLFTEERNDRARAVYAAAGYRPDGAAREFDFRGQSVREVRLVARL